MEAINTTEQCGALATAQSGSVVSAILARRSDARRVRVSRDVSGSPPHLGYGVQETWVGFYPQSVEKALAFLDGKPVRVTNPEALDKRA
jgi:hypothetical protein